MIKDVSNYISLRFRLQVRNEEIKKNDFNFVYATLSGKRSINTGINIIEAHWDHRRSEVKKNNRNWYEYNHKLSQLKHYTDAYNYYSNHFNRKINLDFFSNVLKNNINTEFYEEMFDRINNENTKAQSNKINILKQFINFSDNIYLLSLDKKLMDSYDDYLIKQGRKKSYRQQHFNVINPILDELVYKEFLFPNHSNRYRALLIPD